MNRLLTVLIIVLFFCFGFCFFLFNGLSLLILAIALVLIFWQIRNLSYKEILEYFGLSKKYRHLSIFLFIAMAAGISLAIYYRYVQKETLMLTTLRPFVFVAISIGATEELIYRGYIYGTFRRRPVVAIFIAAFAHAGYKSFIFYSFPEIDVTRIGLLTFLSGLFIGYLRMGSRSVIPSLLFHIVFDFYVYGDKYTPWWIW